MNFEMYLLQRDEAKRERKEKREWGAGARAKNREGRREREDGREGARGREGGEGGRGGEEEGRESQRCAPGTTYWKGLALQMVTAGKSMVLKPMERETLTSQLR